MGQTTCKPGSVPPAYTRTRRSFLWTAHCWTVLATYPNDSDQRRSYRTQIRRAVPIRSCSRRGLPCRSHCWVRGALLPHPFTLAEPSSLSPRGVRSGLGGLLSVALSLGSPPAGVARRLVAVEPGLSSLPCRHGSATAQSSGPPPNWAGTRAGSSGAYARGYELAAWLGRLWRRRGRGLYGGHRHLEVRAWQDVTLHDHAGLGL